MMRASFLLTHLQTRCVLLEAKIRLQTYNLIPHTDIDLSHFDLAFGSRRLAILDLTSAGHMPMSYLNDRLWIVYNGEIYNYKELRQELAGLGHHFISGSDTEVILAAYIEWGLDCLSRF